MKSSANNIMAHRLVLMVGTSMNTMGGISSVVKGYVRSNLFERARIVYVETHGDGSSIYKGWMALSGYLRTVKTLAFSRVSVVHIHLSSRASFWRKLPIIFVSKLFRVPYLLHLHGSEFMTFYTDECGPRRKRLVSRAFDAADSIIVLSPQWEKNVRTFSYNQKITVVFNGVAISEEPPDRSGHPDVLNILFLGRLGLRKGIYDLLDSLAEMKRAGVVFRLVAAGDGEISEVREKAESLNLQTEVDTPGWIDDDDKAQLLSDADVFVLPSHAEGLPMSVLEAMAAALPVVSTTVGGIPTAITDGSEGLLVSPGDVHALAGALTALANNADLRLKFGHNAYNRAKAEFSVQRSVDQLMSVYEQYDVS